MDGDFRPWLIDRECFVAATHLVQRGNEVAFVLTLHTRDAGGRIYMLREVSALRLEHCEVVELSSSVVMVGSPLVAVLLRRRVGI